MHLCERSSYRSSSSTSSGSGSSSSAITTLLLLLLVTRHTQTAAQLRQWDEARAVSAANARTSVAHWLVGDAELS
jgi:hypothetical protein